MAYNNWGNALSDLGRHSEAIEKYDHALKLNPDHSYARRNKKRALEKLPGKADEKSQTHKRVKGATRPH
jgi:tetratricopeptide (TPR) repeat protein